MIQVYTDKVQSHHSNPMRRTMTYVHDAWIGSRYNIRLTSEESAMTKRALVKHLRAQDVALLIARSIDYGDFQDAT